MYYFHNVDEIQTYLSGHILEHGKKVECRKQLTLEVYPFHFCLTNPLNRCTSNPQRKWNLPLALGETLWNLRGDRDVNALAYYIPFWKKLTKSDEIKGSCYGYKTFSSEINQWEKVTDLLRNEPTSRRAVISIFSHEDLLTNKNPDVSCTLSIQFLIRDSQLDCITTMRSNDLIWGLPYDIFYFTFLQEKMANELEIPIGKYFHQAASLHIYKRHFSLAEELRDKRYNAYFCMAPMDKSYSLERLQIEEEKIRLSNNVGSIERKNLGCIYLNQLREILLFHRYRKSDLNKEAADIVKNSHYKEVLAPLL